MTPIERTKRRIRRIEDDISRVKNQATFEPTLSKWQLAKLTASLTAQKRKLARLERQDA